MLDEADTVPVGVDVGPLIERYGPLTNLSVTASVSTDYGDEVARLSVSDRYADSRRVRASPDPELDVAVTYLLAAGPPGAGLDVTDVFQLGHGVHGVRGPSVAVAGLDRLETSEQHLHRTTVDETYRVQDRMDLRGIWNSIDRLWFDVGGRRTQRVHRFPAAASYHRDFRGDGWNAHRGPSPDSGATAQVLSHPMLGLVERLHVSNGSATVSGTPFSDGSGTRFDPPGDHRVSVAVNGTVVREERVVGGTQSVDGVEIDPGQALTVRIEGNNSGGRLSTRTLTEVSVPDYDPRDDRFPADVNRPPSVSNVSVQGASPSNAVRPGEVTAVYEVDAVGPVVNPTVWYAAGAPGAPPWEDRAGWERAETRWFDGDLHATFHVGASAGTASLAAEFRDVRNHRTRTMTLDAVHVGEAPNTSTSMLAGRFLAPNGSAAANDTVVVDPAGDGRARFVSTGSDGRFAVELPRGRSYDLTYLRGEPWGPREAAADGRPAWLPLERVRVDDDVDLGDRRLPEAGRLGVRVTDERGEPVPGATVRVTQRSGNVSVTDRLRTTADGLAKHGQRADPGIALAGTVEVEVVLPEDGLYPEQTHRVNVTVDGPRVVDVTAETAPPDAVLTAYGTFEPGEVVFLHARKSQVPAGVAEYRWDLDGDGAPDQVTEEPTVRYVPGEAERRPTLTVVDRAGKADESTVTVPLRANATGRAPSAGDGRHPALPPG